MLCTPARARAEYNIMKENSKMIKSVKTTLLYLLALALFVVTAVALRTAALITALDEALIYFENGALITASAIVMALFALISISYVFVQERDFNPAVSFENPRTYVPSGLVGVAFFLMSAALWGELFEKIAARGAASSISIIILLAVSVFALISTANFFLNNYHEKRESTVRAAFCLCCAMFMGLYAGHLFFSDALPINAPNKAIDQMAYIAVSIFFLYETRLSLGRAKWRLYLAFGLIAASLTAYSAIPAIIFYFQSGNVISAGLAENALTLTLGIYIVSRITLTVTPVRNEACPTVCAIVDMTAKRDAEIAENENAHGKIVASDEEKKPQGLDGENYEIDFFAAADHSVSIDNNNIEDI